MPEPQTETIRDVAEDGRGERFPQGVYDLTQRSTVAD